MAAHHATLDTCFLFLSHRYELEISALASLRRQRAGGLAFAGRVTARPEAWSSTVANNGGPSVWCNPRGSDVPRDQTNPSCRYRPAAYLSPASSMDIAARRLPGSACGRTAGFSKGRPRLASSLRSSRHRTIGFVLSAGGSGGGGCHIGLTEFLSLSHHPPFFFSSPARWPVG